jgi:hypothetical protein
MTAIEPCRHRRWPRLGISRMLGDVDEGRAKLLKRKEARETP